MAWDSELPYLTLHDKLLSTDSFVCVYVAMLHCVSLVLDHINCAHIVHFTPLRGTDGHDHGDDSVCYHHDQKINQVDARVNEVSDAGVKHNWSFSFNHYCWQISLYIIVISRGKKCKVGFRTKKVNEHPIFILSDS